VNEQRSKFAGLGIQIPSHTDSKPADTEECISFWTSDYNLNWLLEGKQPIIYVCLALLQWGCTFQTHLDKSATTAHQNTWKKYIFLKCTSIKKASHMISTRRGF
jgi:hypothetical protein